MNHEEFCREVTSAAVAKMAVDEFAKAQENGVHFCPRCGRFSVKEQLSTNAMSRHANVYICDACGMDEAIRDFKGETLLLKDWAIAKRNA